MCVFESPDVADFAYHQLDWSVLVAPSISKFTRTFDDDSETCRSVLLSIGTLFVSCVSSGVLPLVLSNRALMRGCLSCLSAEDEVSERFLRAIVSRVGDLSDAALVEYRLYVGDKHFLNVLQRVLTRRRCPSVGMLSVIESLLSSRLFRCGSGVFSSFLVSVLSHSGKGHLGSDASSENNDNPVSEMVLTLIFKSRRCSALLKSILVSVTADFATGFPGFVLRVVKELKSLEFGKFPITMSDLKLGSFGVARAVLTGSMQRMEPGSLALSLAILLCRDESGLMNGSNETKSVDPAESVLRLHCSVPDIQSLSAFIQKYRYQTDLMKESEFGVLSMCIELLSEYLSALPYAVQSSSFDFVDALFDWIESSFSGMESSFSESKLSDQRTRLHAKLFKFASELYSSVDDRKDVYEKRLVGSGVKVSMKRKSTDLERSASDPYLCSNCATSQSTVSTISELANEFQLENCPWCVVGPTRSVSVDLAALGTTSGMTYLADSVQRIPMDSSALGALKPLFAAASTFLTDWYKSLSMKKQIKLNKASRSQQDKTTGKPRRWTRSEDFAVSSKSARLPFRTMCQVQALLVMVRSNIVPVQTRDGLDGVSPSGHKTGSDQTAASRAAMVLICTLLSEAIRVMSDPSHYMYEIVSGELLGRNSPLIISADGEGLDFFPFLEACAFGSLASRLWFVKVLHKALAVSLECDAMSEKPKKSSNHIASALVSLLVRYGVIRTLMETTMSLSCGIYTGTRHPECWRQEYLVRTMSAFLEQVMFISKHSANVTEAKKRKSDRVDSKKVNGNEAATRPLSDVFCFSDWRAAIEGLQVK